MQPGLHIDYEAIAANWRLLADRVKPARCAGVVKDNAYGLGLRRVAEALAAAGCNDFFVAHLHEGVQLRTLLPKARIFLLNGVTSDKVAEDMVTARLMAILNHEDDLAYWRALGQRLNRKLPCWLHVDTGMNRLGWNAQTLDPELEGVEVQGLMSHLACSDEAQHPLNELQLARFTQLRDRFPAMEASFANSGGIFLGPDYHFNLVRPGIALYGGHPLNTGPNPMQPVVSLYAPVLQVREVPAGQSVGYGASFITARPSRLATLDAGYAQGLLRTLSNKGVVAFNGVRAPIVGRVSMDLTVVDVTDVPYAVQPGQAAELIGPTLTLEEQAQAAGTISYEILTRINWPRA